MCSLNLTADKICWTSETCCPCRLPGPAGACLCTGTCHSVGRELSSLPISFAGIELGGQRQGHMVGQVWSSGAVRAEGAGCSAWKSLFVGVLLGVKSGISSPA